MISKPTYTWWNLSSFNTKEGLDAGIFPDWVINVALDQTPTHVKLAVENCFLNEPFDDASDNIKADGLILNAIFWVMHQTAYVDYAGICEAYTMLPRYEEVFMGMAHETTALKQDLDDLDFDTVEWETRYQQS